MTLETLKQCRKAAVDVRKAANRLAEHRASAGNISGMRYGDTPHGRGELLAPQEAYLVKLEQLQEEWFQCDEVLVPLAREVMRLSSRLPYPQNRLIEDYYIMGDDWSTINELHGLNRQQSRYQVRKALEKILERA